MSNFSIDLGELSKILSHVNTVNSESSLKDIEKNVIFDIKKEGQSVAFARNSGLYVKIYFQPLNVVEEGTIQINSGELSKTIDKFSNLSRTEVTSIDFRTNNNRVQVIVHEKGISEEYESFGGNTSYSFDNLKIIGTVKPELETEFDDTNTEDVVSEDLLLVLSTMLPTMDSKRVASNNMLYFVKDQVFTYDSKSQIFFKNILPEVLQNNFFRYNTVSYLLSILKDSSICTMGLMPNKKFGVRTERGDIEAYIDNQGIPFQYESILKGIQKDNGIVIDRAFLKDILRRVTTTGNSDPKFKITEEGLNVTTDNFERNIPILNRKGEVSNIAFKIRTDLLRSLIIGDDSLMQDTLFFYIFKSGSGRSYKIAITDSTGSFISSATIAAA